jgi:hypothetical protein
MEGCHTDEGIMAKGVKKLQVLICPVILKKMLRKYFQR